MPHIEKVIQNGLRLPSVNEITDSLSKKGLLVNFYRKLGFAACDKITKESSERGTEVTKLFEDLSLGKPVTPKPEHQMFVDSWKTWQAKHNYQFVAVEPHLINNVYGYHGSPDAVGNPAGQPREMLDYKVKERSADYKVLMNEAAYIDAWLTQHREEIEVIRIVTFHPKTARVYEEIFSFEDKWFQDFLICKRMWEVNNQADKWFQQKCRIKIKG